MPQRALGLLVFAEEHLLGIRGFLAFFFQKDEMHQQSDDHAEQNGADRTRDAKLEPEHAGSQHDGQHIDRRSRIEEGHGGTETRAPHIDTAEKW